MPLRLALLVVLAALALGACDSNDPDDSEAPQVATATSTVTVIYEGRLEDGTVFNSRRQATFNLQGVIPGFRDGIVGMRIGDQKTFVIPPDQAYGANPPQGSGIPPNAALVFDVELLSVR